MSPLVELIANVIQRATTEQYAGQAPLAELTRDGPGVLQSDEARRIAIVQAMEIIMALGQYGDRLQDELDTEYSDDLGAYRDEGYRVLGQAIEDGLFDHNQRTGPSSAALWFHPRAALGEPA